MTWTSRLPELIDALTGAVDVGLIAGGAVLTDAVQDEHRGGYTSGDYVTGNVLNSIYATEPATEDGVRSVRVTTRQTDPPYPSFWTLGHLNYFAGEASGGALASGVGTGRVGRYLRVDHWTPATTKSADAVAAAFAEGVRRTLDALGDVR